MTSHKEYKEEEQKAKAELEKFNEEKEDALVKDLQDQLKD